MKIESILKNQKFNLVFSAVSLIVIICLFFNMATFMPTNFSESGIIVYLILTAIPLIAIGVIGMIQMKTQNVLKRVLFVCVLIISYLFIILHASLKSGDYESFLEHWVAAYSGVGLKDSLYNIIDVSNYTPAYNYLLIVVAALGANSLFGVKFITYIFSFLFAFAIEKIISFVRNEKFDFLRFAIVLILPPVLMEYSAWGQCDVIYTSFALLAFYFALRKKSKLSFMFIGLSFAFKLQFLFAVPVLFIMLIIKDKAGEHYLKWKDMWIAPLMYSINLVPALAGRSVADLITVYFNQAGFDERIAGCCANICNIYQHFAIEEGHPAFKPLVISHILLTLSVMAVLFIIVFRCYKKKGLEIKDLTFFATVFAFVMVFLMPKMLDRFYFIAMAFAFINFCITKGKNDYLMFVLIINLLFFMMFLHFLKYIFLFQIIFCYALGWGSAFVCFILMICLVVSRYGKFAFSKNQDGLKTVENNGDKKENE